MGDELSEQPGDGLDDPDDRGDLDAFGDLDGDLAADLEALALDELELAPDSGHAGGEALELHRDPSLDQLFEHLDLYQAPIAAGLVTGLVLGYLGVFVVLRRMVFVTVAVSQAAGLGVALASLLGATAGIAIHPMVGAAALALATTAVLSLPTQRVRLSREALLGIAYAAAWAGTVLAADQVARRSNDIHDRLQFADIGSVLFGTAVMVRQLDLLLVTVVGGIALLVHVYLHRGFAFALFDPESARVQGIPVRALDLGSWILIALVISVATRALGVLPVFAFAVLPALTGLLAFDRVRWVLLVAAAAGAAAGAGGYVFAFLFELPVGATQAAVSFALFVVVLPARLLRVPVRA